MSIPLDRLYHYIENMSQRLWQGHVIIYRFYPHGSKDFKDLTFLNKEYTLIDRILSPYIYCNDQEPLDYEKYEQTTHLSEEAIACIRSKSQWYHPKMNLRDYPIDIWDKAILIHSEQRSTELETYKKNHFIPVYYWAHAVIARDWFRYAEHIQPAKNVQRTFLIYNRAWSGTREYRLMFAELVVRLGIENYCQMSVSPVEPELGIHYDLHKFKNSDWRPRIVLENFFPTSDAQSSYSADFDFKNYETTDIEVVLETLFDDSRLHLTEKILRPIACGQPFILAGTHRSLEYLRSYGFKTFGHIWDEQYDQEEDPQYRLFAIGNLMKKIASWTPKTRATNLLQAQDIAEYNKKHFFSQEFFKLITTELETNLTQALIQLKQNNTSELWLQWQLSLSKNSAEDYQTLNSPVLSSILSLDLDPIIAQAKEYYNRNSNTIK
jgi:hypothetical protein